MIRFDTTKLSQYLPTTLLKVGFITNRKQGILLHLSDEHTYVSLVMNNNGKMYSRDYYLVSLWRQRKVA
jgi:hypothetical protein